MMTPRPLTEFFLVTTPGFEDLALAELHSWYPDLTAEQEHGGITVHAPVETGLSMNHVLKIPTRILLRADSFRCKDFPKLYNAVAGLNWRQWIDSRTELEVEAASRESRLKIKKRIESTCVDAWKAYQKKHMGKEKKPGLKAKLFVRFHKDICTLSLDTSGERLHKRGLRKNIGDAPLRETIAAALIQLVARTYPPGRRFEVEIVDPMMGAGTFLLEAAMRDQPVSTREFGMGAYRIQPETPPPAPAFPQQPVALIGFEKDQKTLSAAAENLKPVGIKTALSDADLFTAKPLPDTDAERWLFANPPYGERLKINEPLPAYYAKLFSACEKVARPDRACFILPAKAVKGKFNLPPRWRVLDKRSFSNGGIPVIAFVFDHGEA